MVTGPCDFDRYDSFWGVVFDMGRKFCQATGEICRYYGGATWLTNRSTGRRPAECSVHSGIDTEKRFSCENSWFSVRDA